MGYPDWFSQYMAISWYLTPCIRHEWRVNHTVLGYSFKEERRTETSVRNMKKKEEKPPVEKTFPALHTKGN
jgi:hypothetical protein